MQSGRSRVIVATFVVAVTVLPGQAFADAWFSAYLGSVFGGSTGEGLSEAVENHSNTTYGVNLGRMGNGIFGGEFDLGYTPKFFGADASVESSSVTVETVHGSLLLGIPIGARSEGGVRPYGVIGVGMILRRVDLRDFFDNISTSDFGYNVGVGVMGFFGDVFGLRGEYRYFRNFQKDDGGVLSLARGTFHFSRATAGLVLRF